MPSIPEDMRTESEGRKNDRRELITRSFERERQWVHSFVAFR